MGRNYFCVTLISIKPELYPLGMQRLQDYPIPENCLCISLYFLYTILALKEYC